MKVVTANKISKIVADLCVEANLVLRKDVLSGLHAAYAKERNKRAKDALKAITTNAYIARQENIAICQDTGLPAVFLEIGFDVRIDGDLKQAVNKGVAEGYKRGSLRNSIITDPLKRGKSGYSPIIIHTEITKGNKLKITVLPKGFGCENKAQLKMLNPTAGIKEVEEFIIGAVKSAGSDACPPYVVGVGIGGTADYAMLMAKQALLKPISRRFNELEKGLMKKINNLNIGPMGLGGKATCLGVNIETYPTHIAGLPVAVNISCHALRSASRTL